MAEPADPVIVFMPEISRTHMGGTMRLGLRPTVFQQDTEWSRIRKLYGGVGTVWERHRHRYEVNPAYVERLHTSGMAFIGRDEKGERMQIMELPSASSALPPCATFIHSFIVSIDALLLCRPPLLCWPASTPGILYAPAQSISTVPRFRRGGLRPRRPGGANGAATADVPTPAS